MKWRIEKSSYGTTHGAKGPAGKIEINNAYEIREHERINGSGDSCFGGSARWPCVTICVPFYEGKEEKRNQFTKDFKVFLKEWLAKNMEG